MQAECERQRPQPASDIHSTPIRISSSSPNDAKNFTDPHQAEYHECQKLVTVIKLGQEEAKANHLRHKDQILQQMCHNQGPNRFPVANLSLQLMSKVQHAFLGLTERKGNETGGRKE